MRIQQLRSIIYPLLLAATIGCNVQPEFESVYTPLTSPNLEIGNQIPSPQGEAILTVLGKVGTTNQDTGIVMDLPTVESIGLVEYTVEDPFEKEERTFTGVLMRDLLDVWQVPSDATSLNVTALNDFQIDIPINLVRDYPVIFALQQDGEYMTSDYRGPAMLVFPYDHYDFDIGTDSYWVWQIKTITVE